MLRVRRMSQHRVLGNLRATRTFAKFRIPWKFIFTTTFFEICTLHIWSVHLHKSVYIGTMEHGLVSLLQQNNFFYCFSTFFFLLEES